jgi:RNA polymerase sigma-70 factor (ECF subfamily)
MEKPKFPEVYENNKNLVWKIVSRFVFTKEDREDLFQEIFLKIHKALPRFRGDSSVKTWIYKISVTTSINHIKKQERTAWLKKIFENFRPTKAQEVISMENELEELKPLKKLNPDQRMILILSDVEELKLEEIAKIMAMPVGTVKSNLHRAREIVKKEVIKNGEL